MGRNNTLANLLVGFTVFILTSTAAAAAMSGAIYTSDLDGNPVNANLYDAKCDVGLNGGPNGPNGPVLPEGTYDVGVTDPAGSLALGTGIGVVTIDSSGKFGPLPLCDLVNPVPYLTTTNPGGEYKVWLCETGSLFDHGGSCKTDNFKVIPDKRDPPAPLGSISGTVIDDQDADGDINENEPPRPNIIVTLFGPLSGSATSDGNGGFSFTNLPDGDYDVCEILPPGFIQTFLPADACHEVTISGGNVVTGQDFGNFVPGKILIHKFHDRNMNGVQDDGEEDLAGWTFTVDSVDYVTDANGNILIEGVMPGTYTISEQMQPHWANTLPGPTSNTAPSEDVTVGEDQTVTATFGNVLLGNLLIHKFHDLNMNGVQDDGEQNLEGWEFTVGDASYTTDADGNVLLEDLLPGTYTVIETMQAHWTNTLPGPLWNPSPSEDVSVSGGETASAVFGNVQLGNIRIHKFHDRNMNGVQDNGEENLAGWTFTVDGQDYTTDANGDALVEDKLPGTYAVDEHTQAHWANTLPGPLATSTPSMDALVAGGETVDAVFGNVHLGSVGGQKYFDVNVNGVYDAGDIPLAGIKIVLTGTAVNGDPVSLTLYTDANGAYTFADLYPGTYTVTEVLPGGTWFATGPTSYGFALDAGEAETLSSFTNSCTGAGGGLTLGYWSNKNGQNSMNAMPGGMAGTLAFLSGLNLRTATGANFDPTTYTAYRNWLLSASATNMAYMLSAQLTAMELNVRGGFVNGNSLVYAPGALSANIFGFATVNALMAEANSELGLHGYTVASGAIRTYQEALKTALDRANNNLNVYAQATPCSIVYA